MDLLLATALQTPLRAPMSFPRSTQTRLPLPRPGRRPSSSRRRATEHPTKSSIRTIKPPPVKMAMTMRTIRRPETTAIGSRTRNDRKWMEKRKRLGLLHYQDEAQVLCLSSTQRVYI
jgi:hypothetical protein